MFYWPRFAGDTTIEAPSDQVIVLHSTKVQSLQDSAISYYHASYSSVRLSFFVDLYRFKPAFSRRVSIVRRQTSNPKSSATTCYSFLRCFRCKVHSLNSVFRSSSMSFFMDPLPAFRRYLLFYHRRRQSFLCMSYFKLSITGFELPCSRLLKSS
jgi:hypothetical protein